MTGGAKPARKKTARASGAAPGLRFAPFRGLEGFSSGDVVHNRNAYAAVRELVQNSLDAADKINRPAQVRFAVETVKKSRIPAIAEYEEAFKSSCDCLTRAELFSGQNRNLAAVIEKELQQEEIAMLFVTDNGVGLDDKSMRSLLGSGATTKSETEAGAFGVGHLAAFSLSRMNYLLYGGLCNGRQIGAGHAQLASHQDSKGGARGKDGYFVVDMRADLFDPFTFAGGNAKSGNVPPLLSEKLDGIRKEFKSGSVVVAAGFNFLDNKSGMSDMIQSIVAENFFPAVNSGRLTVEITDGNGGTSRLDRSILARVIERGKDRKSSLSRNFPSGLRVAESYETLTSGKLLTMPFEGGKISVHVREGARHGTNIVIFRKGMWITDSYNPICGKSHYGEKINFDALLLVESDAAKAHDAVRSAEGPLHNELNPRQYMSGEPEKQRMLRQFCEETRNFLNANIKKIDNEPWAVPGFISVDSGKSVGESLRGGYVGKGVVLSRPGGDGIVPDGPVPDPVPEEKPGKPFPVRVASYWEPGAKTVQLVAETDSVRKDAELRLGVDGGADESCANMLWENLLLRRAEMDGKKLTLLKKSGKAVGARLGELPAKKPVHIIFEFEGDDVPDKLAIFCDFRQREAPDKAA